MMTRIRRFHDGVDRDAQHHFGLARPRRSACNKNSSCPSSSPRPICWIAVRWSSVRRERLTGTDQFVRARDGLGIGVDRRPDVVVGRKG